MIRRFQALILALALVLLLGCNTDLLHQLEEVEANHIITQLQQHGISAEKKVEDAEANTWTVRVSGRSAARAQAILDEYKLPKQREPRVRDLFSAQGLVRTPTQEGILAQAALEGELAYTLEGIEGIIDARVHLVMPRTDLTGRRISQAKASVFVEYQPSAQGVVPVQDGEIQKMVAHAVEDLVPANVAVVQKPASIASPATPAGGGPELVSLGGLVVASDTLPALRIAAVTVAGLVVVLGLLLFLLSRRLSRLRAELRGAQQIQNVPSARAEGETAKAS